MFNHTQILMKIVFKSQTNFTFLVLSPLRHNSIWCWEGLLSPSLLHIEVCSWFRTVLVQFWSALRILPCGPYLFLGILSFGILLSCNVISCFVQVCAPGLMWCLPEAQTHDTVRMHLLSNIVRIYSTPSTVSIHLTSNIVRIQTFLFVC